MMNDDMDDLDRALFALPLATPPQDLRASIFNATVNAMPRTFAPIFRTWEVWAAGAAVAVAAWLCIALVAYKGFAITFSDQIARAVQVFANPSALAWFALGCLFSAALWYGIDSKPRLPFRGARS